MSDTSISWTEATWNPVTGCDRVSAGCNNCYALTLAKRLKAMGNPKYQADGDPRTSGPGFGVTAHPSLLLQPLRWRTPKLVFVNSMSDLFHDHVSDDFIARVFAAMALTARHTYQVLTKRHGRMRALLNSAAFTQAVAEHATDLLSSRSWRRWQLDLGGMRLAGDSGLGGGWTVVEAMDANVWVPPWPLPNVWLGVSAENQQWADIRIPALLGTPAALRFTSAEPLLGPIRLYRTTDTPRVSTVGDGRPLDRLMRPTGPGFGEALLSPAAARACNVPALDWLIVGGESGPDHRDADLSWIASLVDQAATAGIAVWVKQDSGPRPGGRGRISDRYWVQQWPEAVR
jgi:protein gp37